nr:disease resistance protein RGA2-like [Ziziphus jujuba var. spinosa]
MAEIILSSIAKGIIGLLGSVGIQEIGLLWGAKDELEQLQDTVSTINAVLLDAETKQNHNHQVKFWLQRLQEVVLDADDLVDDISTEALRKSLMPGNNMVKQIHKISNTFFPSFNQLLFRRNMGHKIKNVRKKLAAIANDRIQLNLEESHGEAKVVNRLRDHTHSFVSEKEVIGKDDDRIAILQLLLDDKTKENLFIIPIVGIGGLGKTTLAQLVFNDEQVQKHFDLKLWMEQLQQILREKINGKRYLLVLDDVWNEDHIKWYSLKSLLLNGVEGSKMIITTWSKVVARITGTMPAYRLKVMDKKKSWALFKKITLEQGQESNMSSNVLEIGMHIVDKCGGIPLAI